MAAAYNYTNYKHDDNLETFSLLWLDSSVHTREENRAAQRELRSSINHLLTFHDLQYCENYIRSSPWYERLVFIVSGRLGEEIVPRIHALQQIVSIYVYCMDIPKNEKWARYYPKVKAVTDRLDDLIFKIKTGQKKMIKIEDPFVFNIFNVNSSSSEQSTTGLNGQFIHSQLLIDVLLRLKSVEADRQELIKLVRDQYRYNPVQLDILEDFRYNYLAKDALYWYSRESFLYRMLNKALRVQNIDLLFLFRFFIRDIYRALKQHQHKASVYVYRGQVLSTNELENLRKSAGDYISINAFFSTTFDREKALDFLKTSDTSKDLHRVLFEIYANPKVVKTKPFADISDFSRYDHEQEVLFMTGTIFRLRNVTKRYNQIWTVEMTLCDDDEHDLNSLFTHMKQSYGGGNDDASLLDYGRVLRQMGKYDLAENVYRRVLNETPSNDPSRATIYYSLGLVLKSKNDLNSSLEYIQKALDIYLNVSPNNFQCICNCYNELGTIHQMNNYLDTALKWFQEGITLLSKTKNINYITLAHFHNNMAVVYEKQKKYSEALHFYKRALDIREQYLPKNDPDIGLSHYNTGNMYRVLGDFQSAIEHYNKALDIRLKSLPANHPSIAKSYRNIGLLYEDLGDVKKSLEHLEKAAAIRRQVLPVHHKDRIQIEEDLKRVLWKLK